MSRCLDLLEPKGASAGTGGTGFLGHHELELQQKRRVAEIDKAFSEISGLIKSKGQEGKREQKAAAAAAAGAADKEAEERREKKDLSKEATKDEAAKAKPVKRNRTASSRVQAKVDAVRADAEGVAKLEAKVEHWRKSRSDGQVERRDFIRENRDRAHAASAASIVSRRSELFVLERQKTAEVRGSSTEVRGSSTEVRGSSAEAWSQPPPSTVTPTPTLILDRTLILAPALTLAPTLTLTTTLTLTSRPHPKPDLTRPRCARARISTRGSARPTPRPWPSRRATRPYSGAPL